VDTVPIRELLRELNLRPSKALGQHFLHDPKIVRRIADLAGLTREDLVVEIGPGLGVLTRELAARAGKVIAIELDARLADYLRRQFASTNVEIVHGDALAVDYAGLTEERPYQVVANLPYSVATAIIERLLTGEHPPERLVVMVQREVAERLAAHPPDMTLLSVAAQFYATPRIAFRIGAGAFVPPPKVESAVILLERREETPLPRAEHARFFRVVRAGFAQRRKRLANALAAGLGLPKEDVEAALVAAGIDPGRRAETLTLEEWLKLYQALRERVHDAG
jgi:16S rRNA (adenine1518-N6/adenine1519-N6)-dimethyltransferase